MTDPAFSIDAAWPQPPADGRADVAHLGISLGGDPLTRLTVIAEGTLRDHFRASAVSLAFWWADNWWRLRHEVPSASGGTLWPPLTVYGTGSRVIIAPAFGSSLHAGPVRYLDLDAVRSVAGHSYEAGVDLFLDQVVQICARARDGGALAGILAELRRERDDPDSAAWRKREAMLGFDPDEAPDGLMERLAGSGSRLGQEAIDEAAVAAPGPASADVLQAAIDAAEGSPVTIDASLVGGCFDRATDFGTAPWQAAERAAASLRRVMGHEQGALSSGVLAGLPGASWSSVKAAPPTAQSLP